MVGPGGCNGVVIIFMIYCMVGLGGCNGVVIICMLFIYYFAVDEDNVMTSIFVSAQVGWNFWREVDNGRCVLVTIHLQGGSSDDNIPEVLPVCPIAPVSTTRSTTSTSRTRPRMTTTNKWNNKSTRRSTDYSTSWTQYIPSTGMMNSSHIQSAMPQMSLQVTPTTKTSGASPVMSSLCYMIFVCRRMI